MTMLKMFLQNQMLVQTLALTAFSHSRVTPDTTMSMLKGQDLTILWKFAKDKQIYVNLLQSINSTLWCFAEHSEITLE